MKQNLKFFFILLSLVSLQHYVHAQEDTPCSKTCNNSVKHDYKSCIDETINGADDVVGIIKGVTTAGVKVSIKEEMELGNEALADAKKKYKFVSSGTKLDNLKRIMQSLVSRVQKPQGFSFSIYLLDTDVLNAWTCGGKIFFTTAMYDFCKNNDEIACILGHEISHNLLGHINKKLIYYKAASQFGIFGQVVASIGSVLTTSFGQKDEAHSDLLGVDLARASGYRECESISLWKRMAEKSGKFDNLSNFLSSHPHPEKRAECLSKHLNKTYSKECGN
jgi:predicted Zn-dependent protease